ncbi:MAG: hypothetical protein HY901_34790 [Deltaproteobacteria bacterium]|nr:hypothetical protein [Deltaproteobacteria bacterium]
MNGAGCRRKGHDWERELARLLGEVFGPENARRGIQYRSGTEVPDVDVPAFWVEAKRGRKTNIRAALKQARTACRAPKWLLAVCKDDKEPAIAAMYLDDFVDLLREWWTTRQR